MSYVKDALYSYEGAKVCRTLRSHAWTITDRCVSCRIVRDDYNAPYRPSNRVSINSPIGGAGINTMEPPKIPQLSGNAIIGPKDQGVFRRTMSGAVRARKGAHL